MPVPGQSSRSGLEMRTSRAPSGPGTSTVVASLVAMPASLDRGAGFLDPVFTRYASLSVGRRGYLSPIRGVTPPRCLSPFTPEIRSPLCRCRRCPPLPAASPPGAAAPLVGTAALVTAAPTAQAVDITSPVVISEVYGGGGSGAQFSNDFIELYNNDQAFDISTWSVQYGSSTGNTWTNRTNLTGSIPAKSFYLVESAGATPSAAADP